MNISPINFALFSNKTNYKTNTFYNNFNMQYDSVSFSGKKQIPQEEFSPEAQEAISLGKHLTKLARRNSLTPEALNTALNEKSPVEISIDDINNCPVATNTVGKTIAHMLPIYTTDFELAYATIFLDSLPNTSKEETDFIANVAHEYTHVLQRAKDKDYHGVFKYTDNSDEIVKIGRMSQFIMNEMMKMCQKKLFTNEKDIRLVLNSILDKKFNAEKLLGKIDFDKMIDSTAIELAYQLDKNPQDVKKAMRGWIIQETQNEKEAYCVTLEILERSKHDPNTKAKRTLQKEIFSLINQKLKEQ